MAVPVGRLQAAPSLSRRLGPLAGASASLREAKSPLNGPVRLAGDRQGLAVVACRGSAEGLSGYDSGSVSTPWVAGRIIRRRYQTFKAGVAGRSMGIASQR
ncbi:hypothetical protein GCM10027288_38150 [Bordetella tumbae]